MYICRYGNFNTYKLRFKFTVVTIFRFKIPYVVSINNSTLTAIYTECIRQVRQIFKKQNKTKKSGQKKKFFILLRVRIVLYRIERLW